jgi:hypothetical protein
VIRAQTKRTVRTLYEFRCGYCGVSEAQVGAELTYDHFRPQSLNGSDEAANLVYACHACNEFKGDYFSEDQATRLLHPLLDDVDLHVAEMPDGTLRPLTDLGQVYIDRIQLNRPALVANRRERQQMSRIETRLDELAAVLGEVLAAVRRVQGE